MLMVLILNFSFAFSKENEVIRAGLMHDQFGLFSVVFYVTGIMREYEKGNYAGVNVDFGRKGPYYQKKYGLNWWNYYFEPIECPSKGLHVRNFTSRHAEFAFSIEYNDKWKNNALIKKYIHVKKKILDKIDNFKAAKFTSDYVIGVHYRGTDKKTEAPKVAYESVLRAVRKQASEKGRENYLVFVATDTQDFVDYLERHLPGKVIKYDCHRSANGRPVHLGSKSGYRKGEEAVIDCLLLSGCDFLIRTSSNLSLCSTFFNPELPVLELSQRF